MKILSILLLCVLCVFSKGQAQVPVITGTIDPGTGNFLISFPSKAGKFYVAQTSLDLKTFTDVNFALAGTGGNLSFALPRSGNKQFYRLFETDNANVKIETVSGLAAADYDSGWVQIATGQTLSLNHNLGVLPRMTIMWGSRSADQSSIFHMDAKTVRGFGEVGCVIENLTTTSFQIQAGGHFADPRGFTSNPIWVRVYFWK